MTKPYVRLAWVLFCVVAVTVSVALASPARGTAGQPRHAASVPRAGLLTFTPHGPRGSARVHFTGCPGTVNVKWAANTDWRWKVEMTRDDSAICDIQAALQCRTRLGAKQWVHGGWVHPLFKWSGVNCPSGGGGNGFTIPWQGNDNLSSNGGATYAYYTDFFWPCPPACVKTGG